MPILPIRSVYESSYSAASYLLLLPLILISLGAFKRKDFRIFLFSISCTFFLFVLNTNIFELSMTKGRSGWNLLLLVPITFTMSISKYLRFFSRNLNLIVFIIFLLSISHPNKVLRPFSEESFILSKNISRNDNYNIFTNIPNIEVASKNLVVNESLEEIISSNSNSLIVMDWSYDIPEVPPEIKSSSYSNYGPTFIEDNTLFDKIGDTKSHKLLRYLSSKNFTVIRNNLDFIVLIRRPDYN